MGVYIKRIRFSVRREGDVVGIAAGNLHTLDIDVADVRQRNAKLLQHAAQRFGYADLRVGGAVRGIRRCRSLRCLRRFLRALHIEDLAGACGDRVAVFPAGRRKADTRFAPDLPLDRAMVVTIVHRIAGAPDAAGTNIPFRDVPAGAYYAQPILWAYHAGVVNGCGADTFCPTQAISRQDLTVILYRYACLAGIADAAQSENVLSGFADADAVSDYARAALAWSVENGILYGRNDHRIDPQGTATRAECAALLWRFVSQYSLV